MPITDATPVLLTKEQIRAVFATAQTQSDYILGLHQLVLGDMDKVKSVDGFCRCSRELSQFVFHLAMDWDARLPNVMKGGAWMNWGFSASGMPETGWEVIPAPVTLHT